ncbi:MAG: hypothetical protein ACLUD0_06130 [Eubacterium ramulus]
MTQEQLQEAIAENQVLYDIASSFIDYLYQIVKGSGFMIMFADQNGHVLKLVGDADIVETAKNQDIPLTEGSCRLESVLGTNAIGTPLFSGKPIQLFAYEHYFELSSNLDLFRCSDSAQRPNSRCHLHQRFLGTGTSPHPWHDNVCCRSNFPSALSDRS